MYVPASNSRFIAMAIGISRSPTRITASSRVDSAISSRIATQHRLLPVDRHRLAVLPDHQIDDHLLREQRFGNDALRHSGGLHTLLFATSAGSLLTLEDRHEVLHWTHIQHFGLFVTDHSRLFAALTASALFSRAGYDLLDTLQMRGQRPTAGMLAPGFALQLVFCLRRDRLAIALGFDLFARDAWLQIQQLQLQVAQRLAALAVLRDQLLT